VEMHENSDAEMVSNEQQKTSIDYILLMLQIYIFNHNNTQHANARAPSMTIVDTNVPLAPLAL
jgi:hypothetical protein